MGREYLNYANSTTLLVIVAIPIFFTIVQALLFIRASIKEANNLGISKETVRKVMVNSATFSILPSLPILITLAILMPVLGKYIPWLRLSVIGSAMYESMAADMTIKAFGLEGLGASGMSPSVFISIVWVMSLAILVGPVLNLFLLKSYDNKLSSSRESGGLLALASGSLFLGMLAIMGMPILFNLENPTGIVVAVVAGIFAIVLDKIAKKTGIAALGEFSFPLSMVLGMSSALLISGLF